LSADIFLATGENEAGGKEDQNEEAGLHFKVFSA
jgi:hypothetical protein